jgi:hypothetical protein
MDLVQDHDRNIPQDRSASLGTEKQIETFRSGDEYFRGMAKHLPAVGLRRIPAPSGNMDLGKILSRILENLPQLVQRGARKDVEGERP